MPNEVIRCLRCGRMLKKKKSKKLCRICYIRIWKEVNYKCNKPEGFENYIKVDKEIIKKLIRRLESSKV